MSNIKRLPVTQKMTQLGQRRIHNNQRQNQHPRPQMEKNLDQRWKKSAQIRGIQANVNG